METSKSTAPSSGTVMVRDLTICQPAKEISLYVCVCVCGRCSNLLYFPGQMCQLNRIKSLHENKWARRRGHVCMCVWRRVATIVGGRAVSSFKQNTVQGEENNRSLLPWPSRFDRLMGSQRNVDPVFVFQHILKTGCILTAGKTESHYFWR